MGNLKYKTVEEFGEENKEDKEAVKVAELRRLEQEGKTMKKFV